MADEVIESTVSTNPIGTDAHFEQALAAAIKKAEAHTPPEAIQEAEQAQAKAEEAAKLEGAKPEAVKPEVKEPEKKVDEPNPAGTLGKIRRLFFEGDVKGALKLAVGVDLEDVELNAKQWR